MVSSWERVGPNVIPHVAKATGIYLNSMLATTEARRAGYDEAIMLTRDGYVADGPGENIFLVKDGRLITPPLSMSILPGITRDTIIQLAGALGYPVEEKLIIRTDLYLADEVFMVGTATEVAPVRAVDGRETSASARSRSSSSARTSTSSSGATSASPTGSTSSSRRARPPKFECRPRADPALGRVARRAGGGARARGAPLRPALARADDRRASRRPSPRRSARRSPPRSRAAPPACTCSATWPASARATR